MDAARKTAPAAEARPWPILVVDDDQDMHGVTALVLSDCSFKHRPLQLVSARSAAEARARLAERDDFALVLLDVVMETEHAGLDLVRHIREELGNHAVRIVLRTGQAGQAPEGKVVAAYDIDGYASKASTSAQHLRTLVMTGLRTFDLIRQLERRQEKLEYSNRELERFAFAASHDLQTPLRGILSLTQLLMRKAGDKLDHDARELLLLLSDNARALHKLIGDLLEYARLGSNDSGFGPVKLDEVLARSLSMLQALVTERGAVIEAEALPEIEGNAVQLESLLRNLVENAIKFQPGKAPRVAVRCRSAARGWRLSVEDHGIGIPAEHRDEVMQMFKRLHPNDRYPGSGMGLALCRKVAELHRGSVEIGETPGGGTTVTLTLPLRQPASD